MKRKELELLEACKVGDLGTVEMLLKEGVNKNVKTKNGESLLLLACRNDDKEMVKLLVEKGVKVNGISNKKESPLMVTCGRGNLEIMEYLIKNGADIKTVCSKKPRGRLGFMYTPMNVNVMPVLFEKGITVDILDKDGIPLLISMASNKYMYDLNDIKELVERGANVNIRDDNDGDTPLIRAAYEGDTKIIRYLIEKGANVDDINKE